MIPRCWSSSQPTRGVDIGAIEFIHERIMQKRNEGCAILLISADLDELFRLSDRLVTLYEGQITGSFQTETITREEIGYYMTGGGKDEPAENAAKERCGMGNGFFQSIRALFRLKPAQKLNRDYLISLLCAVLLAFLVGAGIMLLCGFDPIQCYGALFEGALGKPRAIGNTLAKAMTLALCGLAMSVAAKAGIFNVGGEGQLFMGALAAAVVGAQVKGVPAWVVVILALLASLLAGGLYAWVPGAMKVYWKVDEVITTIMLNSVATFFCSYMANGPLKTTEKGIASGTASIMKEAGFAKLIPLSNLTTAILFAAVAAFFTWYLMTRSSVGFEMKLTGDNDRFAAYGGISAKKLMLWSMVLSGAICGLTGMLEVFGLHKRFMTTISNEFYFDGMLVAMIMRYQPFGVILMSLFFAVLNIGSRSMELSAGISSEVILIVQSIIIFFMAAEGGIRTALQNRSAIRKARREAAAKEAGV